MAEFAASIPTFDTTPNVLFDPLMAQKAQAANLANQAAQQKVDYTAATQPAQIGLLTNALSQFNAPAPSSADGPVAQSPPAVAVPGQASAPTAAPNDPSFPRGLRNNNPLNLTYVEGQPGVIGSDGRFGQYPDAATGVGAAVSQMQTYQDRDGLTTPRQIISKWAPGSDGNNVAAYTQTVARASGLDPDQPINMHDPAQAAKLVHGMALVENGRPLDPSVISGGVGLAARARLVANVPPSGIATDASPPAGSAPTAAPQPVAQDAVAQASVRQLLALRQYAMAQPGGAGMRAVAGIQSQLDNIAGPGGIVSPDGRVYRVPGADQTRFAAANATEAGKSGPLIQQHQAFSTIDQQRETALANQKAALDRGTHAANSDVDTLAAGVRPTKLAPGETIATPNALISGVGGAPAAPAPIAAPPAGPGPVVAPSAPVAIGATPAGYGSNGDPAFTPQIGGANALSSATTPSVGSVNALSGAPAAPAPVSAPPSPNAAQPLPSAYTAPLKPANPSDINAGFLKSDQDALGPILDQGQQAQQAQIRTRAMRDAFAQNPTGAGAGTKQGVLDWVQSTFGPGVATDIAQKVTGLNDLAAAQEATKLALVNAGTQERGTLGSRGSLGAIQLYSSANQNISLQPQAIQKISNMQLVAQQADADYAQAAAQHVGNQRQAFTANPGGSYSPKSDFDQQWQAGRPAQVYAAAMGALNGDPFDKWQKNLTVPETQRVIGILTRADPGAPIQWKGNQTFHVPTGAQGG